MADRAPGEAQARPLRITSQAFAQALADAGVLASINDVTRIVIVAGPDPMRPPLLWVEHIGDEVLLDVPRLLAGDGS